MFKAGLNRKTMITKSIPPNVKNVTKLGMGHIYFGKQIFEIICMVWKNNIFSSWCPWNWAFPWKRCISY